jgi:hypothetical protein
MPVIETRSHPEPTSRIIPGNKRNQDKVYVRRPDLPGPDRLGNSVAVVLQIAITGPFPEFDYRLAVGVLHYRHREHFSRIFKLSQCRLKIRLAVECQERRYYRGTPSIDVFDKLPVNGRIHLYSQALIQAGPLLADFFS